MRHLAIDAGQSGIRARVLEPSDSGQIVRSYEPDLLEHRGIRTDIPLAGQLADAVAAITAEAGRIDTIAVGTTGFTGYEDLTGLDALDLIGVRTALIAHDSTTSYLGALGTEVGAVVAAGTGVVTLAVGSSTVARVDGWGNIMGDAGSGYWFGREALDAAMRAYDGRGPNTILLQRLRAEYSDVESAYIETQSDPHRIRRIASYARWITDAEARDDAVAKDICHRGATELAISVASGLDRVGIDPSDHSPVCAIGGVFRSAAITRDFLAELRHRRPNFRHLSPRGDGLDGAAALLTLPQRSALRSRVTRIELQ